MKRIFTILIFGMQIYTAYPQSDSILTKINNDVWYPFMESYVNLDNEQFMSLHTENVIRVNRDRENILIGEEYADRMEKSNNWQKENEVKKSIEFSFLERIVREEISFEVGYYKVNNKKKGEEARTFYGKFQVILKPIKGVWKIFLDSDTSHEGTISEEDFQSGRILE